MIHLSITHLSFNQFFDSWDGYQKLSLKDQEAWYQEKTQQDWFAKKLVWRRIKDKQVVYQPQPGHEDEYEQWCRDDEPKYRIVLQTDEGTEFQISVPYIGYFERLNRVLIRIKEPEDMSFSG